MTSEVRPRPFSTLLDALRAALDAEPGAEWQGPDITTPILTSTCALVREDLSAEGLAYHDERGRDKTDVVLSCALRLGIEQGLRMAAARGRQLALLVEHHVEDEAARRMLIDWLRNPGECRAEGE